MLRRIFHNALQYHHRAVAHMKSIGDAMNEKHTFQDVDRLVRKFHTKKHLRCRVWRIFSRFSFVVVGTGQARTRTHTQKHTHFSFQVEHIKLLESLNPLVLLLCFTFYFFQFCFSGAVIYYSRLSDPLNLSCAHPSRGLGCK